MGELFNTIFVVPTVNLLMVFYHLFLFVHLPSAFGLAIVALTVVIRLILHPFFDQQMQTTKKMADLKPHLDRLSAKHKGDQKKIQAEQMRLYKEAGINPAAGCIFLIIQMPIFIGLYQTLNLFFQHGTMQSVVSDVNKMLYSPALKIQSIDPWFFGLNLAAIPSKSGIWFYYLVPVVTGLLQYYQVVASTPPVIVPTTTEKKKDEKKNDGEDFQKAMQTQMKYVFPVMIGWFSYSLPLGLSLYWNIFSIFSIMQYRRHHAKKRV